MRINRGRPRGAIDLCLVRGAVCTTARRQQLLKKRRWHAISLRDQWVVVSFANAPRVHRARARDARAAPFGCALAKKDQLCRQCNARSGAVLLRRRTFIRGHTPRGPRVGDLTPHSHRNSRLGVDDRRWLRGVRAMNGATRGLRVGCRLKWPDTSTCALARDATQGQLGLIGGCRSAVTNTSKNCQVR